jgi:hypothetical protein
MTDWKSTKYEPPKAWEEQERERVIAEAAGSLEKRGESNTSLQITGLIACVAVAIFSLLGLVYFLIRG